MKLGVLLVDDEPLIRSGLCAIINAEPDLAVIGEAENGAAVTPLARRLSPDVVLMDVRMPVVDGIEATRRLLANVDDPPRVLVLTTFENDDYVFDALRAGASGFLLKRARADEVVRAIRLAEVLRLIAQGLSNAEIAAQLLVSPETIKTHVAHVLTKLNARDRTQAVIRAYQSGFITPD